MYIRCKTGRAETKSDILAKIYGGVLSSWLIVDE